MLADRASLNKNHQHDYRVSYRTLGLLSQMGSGGLLSSELGGAHGGGSLPPDGLFVRHNDVRTA